jgi:hypothetical protein
MKVSFDGIGEQAATFSNKRDAGAKQGSPAKMSGNGEVSACADNDRFFGICLSEKDGFAAIQTHGFITVSYTGPAGTIGYGRLAAGTGGAVKFVAGTVGSEYLIVDVNTSENKVSFILR